MVAPLTAHWPTSNSDLGVVHECQASAVIRAEALVLALAEKGVIDGRETSRVGRESRRRGQRRLRQDARSRRGRDQAGNCRARCPRDRAEGGTRHRRGHVARAPDRAPDSGAPMAAVALLVALATALVLVVAPVPPAVPLVLSVVVAPLSLAPVAVLTMTAESGHASGCAHAYRASVPAPVRARCQRAFRSDALETRIRPRWPVADGLVGHEIRVTSCERLLTCSFRYSRSRCVCTVWDEMLRCRQSTAHRHPAARCARRFPPRVARAPSGGPAPPTFRFPRLRRLPSGEARVGPLSSSNDPFRDCNWGDLTLCGRSHVVGRDNQRRAGGAPAALQITRQRTRPVDNDGLRSRTRAGGELTLPHFAENRNSACTGSQANATGHGCRAFQLIEQTRSVRVDSGRTAMLDQRGAGSAELAIRTGDQRLVHFRGFEIRGRPSRQ